MGSTTDDGVLDLPPHQNICDLGAELLSVSKERRPCGWLLWGLYPCCGAVLAECIAVEPTAVVVVGRRLEVSPLRGEPARTPQAPPETP